MHIFEAGVCFGVLSGIKGQIVRWKIAMQDIKVSLKIFCQAWNNLMHEGAKHRKYVLACTHVARQACEKLGNIGT